MMHRVFNTLASLCLRIDHIGMVLLKDRNKWLSSVKKVARKVETEKHCIKFDELGVKSFFDNFESLLKSSNFEGLIHEILSIFISHLKPILPEIMEMDRSWSRYSYAIKIRSVLGCGVVFIFGSRKMTATMKQLIAYTDYYVQKALDDAELIGLSCSLRNFSDSVMEGLHKSGKQGKYQFSGGRSGRTGKLEYQRRVLEQQFLNECFRSERTEIRTLTRSPAEDTSMKTDDQDEIPVSKNLFTTFSN